MIRGLDINAFYQEQAQYNRFIDWAALKADPLNFRFIWIKVSEGTDGESYVEGASRCRAGAQSVKFEAINPYHYYLYQYADWSSGSAVWRVISAKEQANAFFVASIASGFYDGHPMTDLEDPLISQFLQWSDTESANRAVAFARKLNAHIRDYHQFITDLFGVRPDIYSGKWWFDKYIPLLIINGYKSELAWMNDYRFILADYDGTLSIPDYIPVDHVIAWQETSSPVPPVKGIPTGRVVPGDALDIDRWMLSDEEFMIWSGQRENNSMALIHDTTVPLKDRAWVIEVKPDQKVNGGYKALGADAIILPMVNMPWDGNHQTISVEGTFKGRCAEILADGLAVFGKIELDAGWVTTEMHTEQELEGHSVWQNLVIEQIIDAWHIGDWTPAMLNVEDFRPVSALIFEMKTEVDHRSPAKPIEDGWQDKFFRYATDKLQSLMSTGVVPNVPIVLKTKPDWLQKYSVFVNMLSSRKSWLYLALHEQKLDSTAVHADLWSIYQWAVWDTFKFSYVPDGYQDRVILFTFSEDKQSVKAVTNSAGVPTPGRYSKYCRGLEAMKKDLKLPVIVPPVEPPPAGTIDLTPILDALKAQDAKINTLTAEVIKANATISRLSKLLDMIENMFKPA